ncbi:hypothetical protein ACG83_10940 [Frankia sp. R43]|uniref:hypothetical protein n=1 Tax=Frankia sp. R43 TaxID=269536 RepID=UPI0006C9FCD3|nr:hypothetical protein [Frankia sp. R43]KPM55781.1 hypothetical protein ACG83_10940 [Frankia sp. R43]
MDQTTTDPADETAGSTDTATRVHLLAVPHHVTLRAERVPDAFGPGHHYEITGHYQAGAQAFTPQVVSDSAAGSADDALRVQLRRFRERGW